MSSVKLVVLLILLVDSIRSDIHGYLEKANSKFAQEFTNFYAPYPLFIY